MSMFSAVRSAGLSAAKAAGGVTQQTVRTRTATPIVVAIPARKKVPAPQMAILAAMMFTGIWVVPAWVLVHIRDYNGSRK
ncbi:cytochrome c oxidase subunit 8 [Arctopsyche grandis]|uniref:cytochrome c oxidase subunit 8 n=1 Tax=Arctopsyche grandis TaxID=121162 RepID=UPI00406D7457